MLSPDAGRAATRALHRAGWLLHAHVVETKLQVLRDAVEDKYDPNQPRVPAGNPGGGQWTDGGGGTGGRLPRGPGTLLDGDDSPSERVRLAQNDPPDRESDVRPRLRNLPRAIRSVSDIPMKKPESPQERNAIVKFVAQEVAEIVIVRAAVEGLIGAEARRAVRRAIGRALIGLKVAAWVVEEGLASIASYSDPPKTLKELQDAADGPSQPGYEDHHIVERNSKHPGEDTRINSRENLVRIPKFKHHQITGYYMSEQREFGRMKPRDVLRGTGWDTRYQAGIKILIEFGALKP
jgi:hypothetical protein